MKKITKTISLFLVLALLFSAAAALPVGAAVCDAERTSGGYGDIRLIPGSAYMENTKWYAWTWFSEDGFDDGFWMPGYWMEEADGSKTVLFDALAPLVTFICIPDSEESPHWDSVIYQSPEIEVIGDSFMYKVTGMTEGALPNIVGEWIWSDEPDDPYVAGELSHEAFGILSPTSTDVYHVGETITIMVAILRYYYSYTANGSVLNRPNGVVLELIKNQRIAHTTGINFRADAVGKTFEDSFTPAVAGTYTVRVGYAKNSIYSVSDENYVGSYTFRVLPAEESSLLGDVNRDGKINIRDVTAIQRHVAEIEPLTGEQLAAADTNGDGVVDINDATHLQMYLAEYDVVLGKQPSA